MAYIWAAPWFGRQAAEIAYVPLLPVSMLLLATLAYRRATNRPLVAPAGIPHPVDRVLL